MEENKKVEEGIGKEADKKKEEIKPKKASMYGDPICKIY